MGLEDRDWYREETAKKNGMRYDKSNATYGSTPQASNFSIRFAEDVPQATPVRSEWHWSLKLVLFLAIILFVVIFVRFANSLA